MKILITGGAGFVGSHLADHLIADGHQVYLLDNLDPQVHTNHISQWESYLHEDAIKLLGDVRYQNSYLEILTQVDVIFHFAAKVGVGQSMYQIDDYVSVNVDGTAKLLNFLVNNKHQVKKFIVASSMSAYGEGLYKKGNEYIYSGVYRKEEELKKRNWEPEHLIYGNDIESIPTNEFKFLESESIYALTKKMQEEMTLSIGKAYKIPTVALRFFNIFGTRQALSNPYTGVVAIFCSRLLNDKSPLIYEDGNQLRDFVHINDICQACKLVMENSDADYKVLNVGSGTPISIKNIAYTLAKKMGKDIEPVITNKFRLGDIRNCFADISQIKKLGYKPKYLIDTCDDLIEWVSTQLVQDDFESMNREMESRGIVF